MPSITEDDFKGRPLEELERRLFPRCLRMLRNQEDAEDALQEAFARAWAKKDSFRGESTKLTWIYRIVYNTCLDKIADRKRLPALVDLAAFVGEDPGSERFEPADPGPSVEEIAALKLLEADLERRAEEPPPWHPLDFMIFRLLAYEELSLPDMVEKLHLPYDYVKRRLYDTVRKKCKAFLSEARQR